MKIRRYVLFVTALSLLVFVLAACDGNDPASTTGPDDEAEPQASLTPLEIIEAGTHTVIDVRTPGEFDSGHVDGAINIDVESVGFADAIAELDPEQSYMVYCRSGNRSAVATGRMRAAGLDVIDGGGLGNVGL